MISRGDVFWMHVGGKGSEPQGRRPVVVVQHDRFNHTKLQTIVVAAITSNLRLAALPGNVRLPKGEAHLTVPCVVNVTQLVTIDRSRLMDRAGRLSLAKREEIAQGLQLLLGGDELSQ